MISKEMLKKFKNLYFTKYRVKLSDEETTQMATDFLNLMKILLKPDAKEVNK